MLAADDDMPIIAYMGVPNDQSTDQNFQDFSDCGFNVSLYGYATLQELLKACNVAQRHGVRILGHCPETHDTPEVAASILKNHPGFFGYVLQDEPSAIEIRERQKEIERLEKVDNEHCFYINLHPFYADWTLLHTKTKSYDEYVDEALTTSCRQLSFDYYPVTKHGLRDGWFSNLEVIRKKCLSKGIPFWGFVLSVPHALYPQPTIGSLRLQVYSNLAYGAQAIQYFTYWTPAPEGENDFHNGPIDVNGKKTTTYELVRQMNQELKTVAKLFHGARVLSVHHLGVISKGTSKLNRPPLNISSLRIEGGKGIVVSQFEKDAHAYLTIVNKDYRGKMKVFIQAKNHLPIHITKELKEEPLKKKYQVSPGDILLFRLQ
jgi:hypothetical protein